MFTTMAIFANTPMLTRNFFKYTFCFSRDVSIPIFFTLLLGIEICSAEVAGEGHYTAGLEYGSQGAFIEAQRELQTAKRLDPSQQEVYASLELVDKVLRNQIHEQSARHLFKGMILRDQGHVESAILELNRAIEIEPSFGEFYYFRGLAHEASGRYSAAMQDYNSTLKLKPNHCEALYRRGVLHSHNRQYDEAIADLSDVIKLHPDHGDAYFLRGNAYHERGQYNNALADYAKVLSIRPTYAQAHYNRGNTYERLGRYKQAIYDFTKALEYDLGEWQAEGLRSRGAAYVYTGQVERAITDLNKLIELKPADAHGYIRLGIVFMVSGHRSRACAEWKKACSLGECRYFNQARYNSGC